MTRAKISHAPIEILHSPTAKAKVGQAPVEVLISSTGTAADLETNYAIGTYGDLCDTDPPDAAWTGRNVGTVTGSGNHYIITMDAQGDAFLRAFTDPAADFEMMAHFKNINLYGGMIGLCALDANGTGRAFSPYNDGQSYNWAVTTYAYSGTGAALSGVPTVGDFWLHMRRVSNSWSGRYKSSNGTLNPSSWSPWTTGAADSRTITQIGILRAYTSGGTQTVHLERFLYGTTEIGNNAAVISQAPVEVLFSPASAARVSQAPVEILISDIGSTDNKGERTSVFIK